MMPIIDQVPTVVPSKVVMFLMALLITSINNAEASFVAAAPTPPPQSVVLQQWAQLPYAFSSPHEEQESLANGSWVPINCAPTGIKVHENRIYLTVPRWRRGVPATLVTLGADGRLVAFPSFEAQAPDLCNNIQYVQSMEIDRDGIMWVVDVGRKYFLDDAPADNSCPPKVVLLDLKNEGAEVARYVFPDAVAPHNASFLNDIVVDQDRSIAYISDAGGGGIVVYDHAAGTSRRYDGASTKADPSVGFSIDGVDYGNQIFTTPADGIALSADTERLLYCALQGLRLYELPTHVLRDMNSSSESIDAAVIDLGTRAAPADGMVFSNTNQLYLGGLTTAAVYKLNGGEAPAGGAHIVAKNNATMWWPDTFAFDGEGSLLYTTNHLDLFFTRTLDPHEINYRIISLDVGERSYIDA